MPLPYLIDHIGIATPNLELGSVPYLAMGLTALPDEKVHSQKVMVRAFQVGDSLIELLAPTDSSSPIAVFLEKRGPGMHHMAFRVEHLETEILRFEAEGAIFISKEPRVVRSGTRVVFLHPKWSAGTLIELVEHQH